MRVMGLDVGERTIGVAISDELGITAQPIKTILRKSREEDWKDIAALISEFSISRIVVGLPKNMDGTLGPQAHGIIKWVNRLQERVGVPVVTWDERLSTVEATNILLEADISRRKRKKVIDKLAAVLILQGYLDSAGKENDSSPSLG